MLTPGTKLAHYEILDSLGAGGMGEVYRARDERLGRDVALKVLPEAFLHDPDRLARFRREAQALASLNHPHIAAIHGLEEVDGQRFLVLELVEGETLDLRIARGPLPLDDALSFARQIAEALEAAHDKGIIHRDLKPSNVKVTPEGSVKLLDFGLAKAFEGEVAPATLGTSPTLTAAATRAGVILGTAAYMSPEQARARDVDRRADLWAFGCLLYEMLTGKQAFPGETVSDTLASILKTDPDLRALPAGTPAQVVRLLRRCLQKDSRQRLQSIADARLEIDEALAAPGREEATTAAPISQRLPLFWGLTGLLLGTLLAAGLMWWLRPTPGPQPVTRFALTLPAGERLALQERPSVALSPDEARLAYVTERDGVRHLFVRALARLEPVMLPGTDGAANPFFSPDGQWIGFFADGRLKKVSVQGGNPIALCEAPGSRGAAWGPDDMIVFSPAFTSGLMRISAAGGQAQTLTTPDRKAGERTHRWPEVLPGGKAVVFVVGAMNSPDYYLDAKVAVVSIETGKTTLLPVEGTNPHYLSSGHLVLAREGGLFAVPFDAKRLEVTGPSVPVLEDVAVATDSGAAHFAVSGSGSLLYLPGTAATRELRLAQVDRKGTLTLLPAPVRLYRDPRLSPDGKRLAVAAAAAGTSRSLDLWVYDLQRGTLTRLTFGAANSAPAWAVDGKHLAFGSERNGVYGVFWKPADGSGTEEQLIGAPDFLLPEDWSPDGKSLVYTQIDPINQGDLWVLPLEGERKSRPFLKTQFDEFGARFSPDGRWIAYGSNESGQEEVYVQPFPGPGGRWQISTNGGVAPEWSRSSPELFYLNGDKMMSVPVSTKPIFSAGTPHVLFEARYALGGALTNSLYDASADGQRFYLLTSSEPESVANEFRVVLSWAQELKRAPSK